MVLQQSTFTKQLVSNGKLAALRKRELKFRVSEELASTAVKNGQSIAMGAVIAKLNTTELEQEVAQAKTALQKAKLYLQDVLIGMGYELNDAESIPDDKMELARIKSGYTNAESNLEETKRNLSYCTLTAPFTGKVANIKQKVYEKPTGEAFCTLIDDSQFEINMDLSTTIEDQFAPCKVHEVVT